MNIPTNLAELNRLVENGSIALKMIKHDQVVRCKWIGVWRKIEAQQRNAVMLEGDSWVYFTFGDKSVRFEGATLTVDLSSQCNFDVVMAYEMKLIT